MSEETRGRCKECKTELAKRGMAAHLRKCVLDPGEALFVAESRAVPSVFWLYLAAGPAASVRDLDLLLKGVWLDCCGHSSEFSTPRTRFAETHIFEGDSSLWDITRLTEALRPGERGHYAYDYGTTSHLVVRALRPVPEAGSGDRIRIIARNARPELACDHCEREARWVCSDGARGHFSQSYCCSSCPTHESSHEMGLPLDNSPRAGMCGYGGWKEWGSKAPLSVA